MSMASLGFAVFENEFMLLAVLDEIDIEDLGSSDKDSPLENIEGKLVCTIRGVGSSCESKF